MVIASFLNRIYILRLAGIARGLFTQLKVAQDLKEENECFSVLQLLSDRWRLQIKHSEVNIYFLSKLLVKQVV